MKKENRLWSLFSTTFLISASTSGGYAIISIMKDKFVHKNQWVEENEMIDLISIAQSTPGPIAINASILVGYKVAGLPGALITMLGTTLPPLIIMSIVANFYYFIADNMVITYLMKGMSAAVGAILLNITIDLFINLTKMHSLISYLLAILAFCIARFTSISYLYIAIFCGLRGIIKVVYLSKKEGKNL